MAFDLELGTFSGAGLRARQGALGFGLLALVGRVSAPALGGCIFTVLMKKLSAPPLMVYWFW
ncbi:MAG: hypothetical protein V2A61_01395, partial [Calditrichota bacterium]